jgi:hypothetical protein
MLLRRGFYDQRNTHMKRGKWHRKRTAQWAAGEIFNRPAVYLV